MSLARALTKRYRAHSNEAPPSPTAPTRAMSTRKFIDRAQISLPVELLSSTNALAYDAPDLNLNNVVTSPISSASSTNSYSDSDSQGRSSSSSVSSPDLSRESSPTTNEPTHISSYFHQSHSKPTTIPQQPIKPTTDAPSVPTRALSHTKQTHQAMARKRSMKQVSSPTETLPKAVSVSRSSMDMFSSKPDANHPFGAELEKVNELAEEFGVNRVRIYSEEEQFLIDNGLRSFSADDYVKEIQGLFSGMFDDGILTQAWL